MNLFLAIKQEVCLTLKWVVCCNWALCGASVGLAYKFMKLAATWCNEGLLAQLVRASC